MQETTGDELLHAKKLSFLDSNKAELFGPIEIMQWSVWSICLLNIEKFRIWKDKTEAKEHGYTQ